MKSGDLRGVKQGATELKVTEIGNDLFFKLDGFEWKSEQQKNLPFISIFSSLFSILCQHYSTSSSDINWEMKDETVQEKLSYTLLNSSWLL